MDDARGGVIAAAGSPDAPGFAEVFAALPVAALVIDPRGRIAGANAASETLLNFSERAMIGQNIDDLVRFSEEFADRRGRRAFSAFDADVGVGRAGRMRVDLLECDLSDVSGWRLMTLHTLPGVRGQERRAGARAATGAAAMLAHEIKNPLSGIRGAAQLLGEADGASDLTTLITREVDRVAALIDRMQDFTDTRPPSLAAHNLYPMLDHVRRVAEAGFARGIAIEERFDPSLPPALIDADAFTQIALNLVKNACEAVRGRPDARIALATAYRHGMAAAPQHGRPRRPLPIEFSVIDNGPGAPADIADHVFEPFVSGKAEGRGLGLSLVDKLAGDMGGMVTYAREGEPKQTVFRVLLPRATS